MYSLSLQWHKCTGVLEIKRERMAELSVKMQSSKPGEKNISNMKGNGNGETSWGGRGHPPVSRKPAKTLGKTPPDLYSLIVYCQERTVIIICLFVVFIEFVSSGKLEKWVGVLRALVGPSPLPCLPNFILARRQAEGGPPGTGARPSSKGGRNVPGRMGSPPSPLLPDTFLV